MRKSMEDVLDINQLALRLGDSVDTIERNIKRNPIQVPPRMYVRGNAGLLRWRLETVEAWVRGREAGRNSPRQKRPTTELRPELASCS